MENVKKELRGKYADLSRKANALVEEKGGQVWTAEEQGTFDAYTDEMVRIQNQMKAIEKKRELDAEKFFDSAIQAGAKDENAISIKDAMSMYLRKGNAVNANEAMQIRNAMSTGTNSEGGYTVPSEIASIVIDAMKATGGMREVATVITTETGAPLNYPTSDGTAETGAIVAENGAAAAGDITFGTAAVTAYKYTSKKIALPVELVMDSGVDIVNFVMNRLATRLARITNTHYTVGSGSSQPYGVIARATSAATTANGTAISYDELVTLQHSVDIAYRQSDSCVWMMADSTAALLKKLKDSQNRPLWIPALSADAPDMLLGKRVVINNDVAAVALSSKSIAFGDFSKYIIRDVAGSYSIMRFDDSGFALNGQVGFCGWMRTGGNLTDTAAVKVLTQKAS